MANIKIAILNQYAKLKDTDVEPLVNALQVRVHRDFAPITIVP